jgi:hypothetical protein
MRNPYMAISLNNWDLEVGFYFGIWILGLGFSAKNNTNIINMILKPFSRKGERGKQMH